MATSTRSRYFRLLFAVALIFALMTPLAATAQDSPDWSFRTETPHDIWSEGGSWAIGTPILVLVNDDVSGADFDAVVEVEQTGPNPEDVGWWVNTGDFVIEPGDIVTVDDGTHVKDLEVLDLTIDEVDQAGDGISGTAPAGATFPVHASDGTVDANVEVTAEAGGAWTADFSGIFDIRPGTWGSAAIFDLENDATQRSWNIQMPELNVSPRNDMVDGHWFVMGATVTVEIDDPANGVGVDWADSSVAGPAPWDADQSYVSFAPGDDGFDVAAGQTVTMSDGTTTKTLDVSTLAITAIDVDNDLVHGTATADGTIQLWASDGQDPGRHLVVGGDGTWTADYTVAQGDSGARDIAVGDAFDVNEYDDDGDTTHDYLNVPNPQFSVETPNQVWSHGDGWIAGRTVTVTVNDGVADLYSTTAEVTSWGPSPWEVGWSTDTGSFEILPGHVVAIDDGVDIVRTLDVVALEVTDVDEDTETITGTAPPDAWIDANAGDEFEGANRRVQADGAGLFTVDFGTPGVEDWEQDTIDLRPGIGGSVQFFEDDGDSTHRGWRVADPSFGVDVIHEELWATDWPVGVTLNFQVFEPDDLVNPVWADSMTVVDTTWGQSEAGYRFWGDFDVHAGQHITITDGTTARELIVSSLEVTSVDPDTDRYTGTVDETVDYDLTHEVCAWARDLADPQHGVDLCTLPEADGTWTIDFTGVGEIFPGEHTGAYQLDPDGDQTNYSWHVPPWLYVEIGDGLNPDFPDRIHLDQWVFPVDVTNGIDTVTAFDTDGDGWERIDFDVTPGQTITATGSDGRVKSLYVEELSVDTVTLWNEVPPSTVYGSTGAVYDGNVQVTASADYGWWTERWVQAAGGAYEADFANPGNGWREQELAYFGQGGADDVYSGGEIRTHIWDADNDQVQAVWHASNPRIIIVRGNDRIEAIDFPKGEPLTIELDDPAFDGIEFSETGIPEANPDEPWETLLVFELGEYTVPDVATVTALDQTGTPLVETEVIPFTIDIIDPDADTIAGTATEGSEVLVEADGNWRYPVADATNTWIADFSEPGDQPGEENPVDIGPGSFGGATLIAEGGSATTVLWSISNAAFSVDPEHEHVWGGEFAPNASVTITIDGSGYGPFDTDGGGSFDASFDPAANDIAVGSEIVVSDGETDKTHVVTALAITGADEVLDQVSGLAEAGTDVQVWVNEPWALRDVAANDGTWTADFSGEVDLRPGSNGGAQQWDDDGDSTHLGWQISNPTVNVDPRHDGVWGDQWAPNDQVTISINDVEHSTLPTDEWGNFGEGWDPQGLDIIAGDKVEATQGDAIKTHYITSLAITGIDVDTEVMTGTADGPFDIWVHDTGAQRHVDHDGIGEWSVDWSLPGPNDGEEATADLEPGTNGNANECDDDGDCTWAGWNVANPAFSVETPFYVWSHGEGWVEDRTLSLMVDDDADPTNGVLYWDETIVERWGPQPWEVGWSFELEALFAIEPGHYVSVDDGVDIAGDLVVDELEIAIIDEDSDTVTGFAPPGAHIEVNAGNEDYEAYRSVDAGPDGTWFADFSVPGDEEHEQELFDIAADTGGAAQIFDDDGDSTHRGWYLEPPPQPAFFVAPESDELWGHQWSGGPDVTITIDDDEDIGNGVLFEIVIPTEDGYFHAWLGDQFDIATGHRVVVTDGEVTKTHEVTELTVMEVDVDADVVHGIATAGAEVLVGSSLPDGPFRFVEANADGNWTADFSQPWEDQDVLDIVYGVGGFAEESDEDGDATHAGWQAVAPSATVEGHVYLDGAPLPDVEVWTGPDGVFTCTDASGYFTFDGLSAVDEATVATGPSYSDAGCGNTAFVDPDGMPLMVASDEVFLIDGYEYVELNVEYAAAIQYVRVEDISSGAPVPVDDVPVRAFDRNDEAFVEVFGHDPDPADYPAIWDERIGQVAWIDWTGAALDHEPGLAEVRYPYVTDVLILAELDPIQGAESNADEFVENPDGIVEGPEILFQIGEAGPVVTVDDLVMDEGDRHSRVTLTFRLSEPLPYPVTVEWATEDGTALAGEDYKAAARTFTFYPGATTVTQRIRVLGDTIPEDDEHFAISLVSVLGAAAGDGATVTLLNDDDGEPPVLPELSVSDAEVVEGDGRDARVAVTFSLTGAATSPVTFTATTVAGSALPGEDYVAMDRTFTIGVGNTSRTVYLRVVSDTIPEPDEIFTVEVSNVIGATVGDGVGEVTILNDD